MDPHLYHQVLMAIQVSHSPVATPQERTTAYSFSEEFKNRSDCAMYALAMFKNPMASSIHPNSPPSTISPMEMYMRQHFALHILEHYVLTQWSRLPISDQVSLRGELMRIFFIETSTHEDPVFIKEKKVALIAQIAKRQFPQRWPDFLNDILTLWKRGTSVQIELLLMILRSLAEDCVSSSFNSTIPPARRKDILQGLNVCLPQLFPVVYQELEKQYTEYQHHPHITSQYLIAAALQMLKEFLDWMPIDKPVEPSTNLIVVAIQLLQDPPFRIAAAECLQVYVSRTFGKEHRTLMIQTIRQIIERVNPMDLHTLPQDEMEPLLIFHKKINELLITWGTTQLDLFLMDQPDISFLMVFLQTLCRLFAHPSIMVTESQIVLWLTILKQKQVVNHPDFISISTQLREICFEKYFKLGSPDREYETCTIWSSRLEFDDHEEYLAFYGNFRGRLYAMIRLIVQLNTRVALNMLRERLSLIYSQYPIGTDHLSERGFCTEITTAYLYHEGMTALMDCVIRQLPSLETLEDIQIVHSMIQIVLSFHSDDPLLKYRQLWILSVFPKFYIQDGTILTSVFEVLFSNIEFTLSGEDVHAHMSLETINVRRRALASLISICQAIPHHILPVLPVLYSKVQDFFAKDRILDSEGVLLYEMLVLVSNSMPHPMERVQFIQQITQDPLTIWTSSEISTIVSSAQHFVSAVESAASNGETRKILFKMVNSLTTLYAIAKRVLMINEIEPLASIWPQVIPNLVALIHTLHSLQETSINQAILKTTSACWLMTISIEEMTQLLGGKQHLEEEAIQQLPVAAKWSKWHKNIRDICYHLMGAVTSQSSVYASGQMGVYMQTGMLSNIDLMNHRHFKTALGSVFLPFLKGCPKELYPNLLDPVLQHVLTHLTQRFTTCFIRETNQEIKTSRLNWCGTIVGVEEAKRDVVYEKMLMDLLRQVMEFIESAIDAKTVIGTDTDTPKHVVNQDDEYLRDYLLLQSPTIPFLIGSILGQAITWKDTMSCKKATSLAEKLVNILYQDARFHEMLGRDFMTAALQAVLDERDGIIKEDGLKWELINLIRNLYCRLTLGLTPVEECKGFDPCHQPRRFHTILPRTILLSLPEIMPEHVDALDAYLLENHSIKSQKNAIKEVLEIPMLAIKRKETSTIPMETMSLLVSGRRSSKQIEDLPEKLVIPSKEQEAAWKTHEAQHANLNATSLFSSHSS